MINWHISDVYQLTKRIYRSKFDCNDTLLNNNWCLVQSTYAGLTGFISRYYSGQLLFRRKCLSIFLMYLWLYIKLNVLVLSDLWSSWFCSEKFLPKQPFTDVLQNRCSWKFHKILWWTPTLESLFNKVAGLQQVTDLQAYDFIETRLHPKCFLVNFVKYLRMSFLQNTTRRLLLSLSTECLINSFDSRLHIRLWNPPKTLFTKNFSTQGLFNKCDHIRSVLGI